MAEDLISTTVELICKDSKNLNKIHDLLKDLESDSESEVVNSAEILFQVFLYHINGGTWTNKLLSNNNKSKKDDKTNEASKTVALWLSSSYTAFVQLLTRKIFYGSSEFQCKLLHFFVDIVNADFSFAMKNRNKPVKEAIQENFPVAFIMLVKEFMLNDLLSNENLSEDLMSLLQFLDISYFILKSIEKVFNDKNEENTNMGTKELENTLKLLLVASKNVSGIIDEDPLLHAEKFLNNNESLCGKITNNLKKSYKSAFTNTWLLLLRQNNMTSIVRKKILVELDSKVMPFLKDPTLLIDFLTDSFNEGGVSSILALNGLFVLINQHNLDYPDFYNKLYTIIDSTIFHMKYKARFFYLIDLFLSSTHLPAYLIAAFVKKFARMLLFAPAPDQMLLLTFIKNMLIRHPSCRVLIHRKKVVNIDLAIKSDPFKYDEQDPSKCEALHCSLWEVETLASHFSSEVKKAVASFRKNLPVVETDISDYFEQEYEHIFDAKIDSFTEDKKPPFEFVKKKGLLEELDSELWIF